MEPKQLLTLGFWMFILGGWGLYRYFQYFRKIPCKDSLDYVLNVSIFWGNLFLILGAIVCFLAAAGFLHLKE
ncbi:MAG: hypothetical protein D6748_05545 [Calditrichaeota bacterium]|nr:MAG: hypothetical protein D6748_05545 [Calditrichota bacterium]